MIAVLVFFIVYLLWMPIIICIDTTRSQYYINLKGIGKLEFLEDRDWIFGIRFRLFGLSKTIRPLKPSKKVDKKGTEHKKPIARKLLPSKLKVKPGKILNLLKSFRLTRFALAIDTSNCITNAKLYPYAAFVNHHFGPCQVNFTGRNLLVLKIENRPIRLLRYYFKH